MHKYMYTQMYVYTSVCVNTNVCIHKCMVTQSQRVSNGCRFIQKESQPVSTSRVSTGHIHTKRVCTVLDFGVLKFWSFEVLKSQLDVFTHRESALFWIDFSFANVRNADSQEPNLLSVGAKGASKPEEQPRKESSCERQPL